jgi:hypothetical protein
MFCVCVLPSVCCMCVCVRVCSEQVFKNAHRGKKRICEGTKDGQTPSVETRFSKREKNRLKTLHSAAVTPKPLSAPRDCNNCKASQFVNRPAFASSLDQPPATRPRIETVSINTQTSPISHAHYSMITTIAVAFVAVMPNATRPEISYTFMLLLLQCPF